MDVEVKLSRPEGRTWGLRLSGGVDFSFPLTAVRVTVGGLAEQSGLRAGDVIMKINGETISHLRHCEALERIVQLGDEVPLCVLRDLKLERKPKKPKRRHDLSTDESITTDGTLTTDDELDDDVYEE